jgi:LEA14-like dessication related protein
MLCLAWPLFFFGCSSIQEVLVPKPPSVEFDSFNSVSIQPEGIRFEVKLRVKNMMPVDLPLDRIDYQFDLNHKKIATGTLNLTRRFGGRAQQVITFPFLLSWEDLIVQASAKSGEEGYAAAFHGTLALKEGYPLPPVPFSTEAVIPIPKWPSISLAGTEGSPLNDRFAVKFNIKNNNSFAMGVRSVDTKLNFNNTTYDLLQEESFKTCGPNETQVLSLRMTNTLVKGFGMMASTLINQKLDFQVLGRVDFDTPFGALSVPLDSKRLGQKPVLGKTVSAAIGIPSVEEFAF